MALTKVGKEGITGISNASNATAITIDASENVGIGTASPSQLLDVSSTGGPLAAFSSSATEGGYVQWNRSGTAKGYIGVGGSIIGSGGADNLSIRAESSLLFSSGGSSERMRLDSSGNLLVGTTATMDFGASDAAGVVIEASDSIAASRSGNATLWLKRFGSDGAIVNFYKSTSAVGSISVNGSATAYNTSSDYRLKENVDYDWDATTRLKQLKPARFNFITDADTTVDGFIAHEAQTVVPNSVTGTKDEVDEDGVAVMQSIDNSKLVPLLVKTIQELEARLTAGGL